MASHTLGPQRCENGAPPTNVVEATPWQERFDGASE
jgi:hypothetical protein